MRGHQVFQRSLRDASKAPVAAKTRLPPPFLDFRSLANLAAIGLTAVAHCAKRHGIVARYSARKYAPPGAAAI